MAESYPVYQRLGERFIRSEITYDEEESFDCCFGGDDFMYRRMYRCKEKSSRNHNPYTDSGTYSGSYAHSYFCGYDSGADFYSGSKSDRGEDQYGEIYFPDK